MSTPPAFTTLEDIVKVHSDLRAGFKSGKFKSIPYRKYQLLQLAYLIKDNVKRFEDALASDLGRPTLESNFLEIGVTIKDAKDAYDNVEKWAKSERAPLTLNFGAMRPTIRKEPKGVVLIISPFNYPVLLLLGPLAGAIAAGNAVVLKPSEKTPAVSFLTAELVAKYLDPDLVRVVTGAIPETTKLLSLQWDHIMYTGGARVGKIVTKAAAEFLTPVTLELGGKSPVVVDPRCDLPAAARRILWGKIINAGQTCTAPDYVLVPKHFQDTFVEALKDAYAQFFPESAPASQAGAYSRLISTEAFDRVVGLLKSTKGSVVIGGETNEQTKFIAPTVVKDVAGDDVLMAEEIFGPVLPIVPVADVDEAIAFINARDHPLALYVFSQDAAFKAKIFNNTQSGAAAANETVIHIAIDGLPFGGIGASGSGYHTGKFSFDLFTHLRASLDSPTWVEKILSSRYPPYTPKKEKFIASLLTPRLPSRPAGPPPAVPSRALSQQWWLTLALAAALTALLTTKRDKMLYLLTSIGWPWK